MQEEELKAEKNSQSATNTTVQYNDFFTGNKLPKELIIRGHDAFSKIFESSAKTNSGALRAYVRTYISESKSDFNSPSVSIKAGFVVTKKRIKSSVRRNRIKRLLRESYRTEKTSIDLKPVKKNFEIIFTLSDSGYENFKEGKFSLLSAKGDMQKLLIKIFKQNA
ncbi:MAG: ribonuclease P protein component [Bacteroidetes bacterium]|nr:ribonuclease P protein component [Bacteroidota bacterium]